MLQSYYGKKVDIISDKLLFGENYPIYKAKENSNKIILHIKSKLHQCGCPHCHQISNSYHSTYIRKIQDTPIHNTETWLYISAYKYNCLNSKCNCKIFVEALSFAKYSQVKTDALILFILGVSIFLSNSGASLILSLIGVKVSADTIKNIYDLKTHRLIVLLEGRDSKTLEDWINNHKKVKLVARDRASAYASAINKVLPECIQVADKYHLLEKLKDIFKKDIPDEIFTQNGKILNTPPKKVKDLLVEEEVLQKLDYDNSIPIDENNNPIKFDNKSRDLNSKQYKEDKDYKIIISEFSISLFTAKKYINTSKEEIKKLEQITIYKKRKTKLDDYDNIIYKMLKARAKRS